MCELYTCISLDDMSWQVWWSHLVCELYTCISLDDMSWLVWWSSCVWAVYMHITRCLGWVGGHILYVGCIHAYH